MKAEVKKQSATEEYWFEEGCHITEVANDEGDEHLSIAKARVEPGTTTAWHRLEGVTERYIILSGCGLVELGESYRKEVQLGDVVRIPAGVRQRITNRGGVDLVFFAVCAPPFTRECYTALSIDSANQPS